MRWKLVSVAALAGVGVATPAVAAWTASGSANGSAAATQLAAPGAPAASSATTSSLSISWTAATAFASGSIGYWVERAPFGGSAWANACGTAETTTTAALSCTDSGLSAGTDYQYRVTSVFHAWRKTGATSAKLSTAAAATYTYALAPVVAGSKVAGTPFAVSVTRSDSFNGTAPITLSGSNPSPSGQAAAYPAAGTTVTFVNGVSTAPVLDVTLYRAGSNTIDISDGTRTGSGSVTVVAATPNRLWFTSSSTSCSSGASIDVVKGSSTAWTSKVSVADLYGNARTALVPTTVSVVETGDHTMSTSGSFAIATGGQETAGTLTVNAHSGTDKSSTITANAPALTSATCIVVGK